MHIYNYEEDINTISTDPLTDPESKKEKEKTTLAEDILIEENMVVSFMKKLTLRKI
jgi:hypothetical protein